VRFFRLKMHPADAMYRSTVYVQRLSCWLLCWLFVAGMTAAQDAQKERLFQQQVKPLLEKYCYDCHDADTAEGDFNLAAFKQSRLVLEQRTTWLKLMQRVSFEDMPPKDGPSLPKDDRKNLLAAIDDLINKADCTQQTDPGRVTIRRLNRFEYRNTIRDLLNVDYEPAADFPGDDVGYGFDNIGDVLSLPTLLMEKYLAAAEEISLQAIPSEVEKADLDLTVRGSEFNGDGKSSSNAGERKILFSNGQVTKKLDIPVAGKYALAVFVFGQLAGDEDPKMSLLVDGQEKRAVSVDEPDSKPLELKMSVDFEKGEHAITIAFLNDFYDPKNKNRQRRDRNLGLAKIKLVGPIDRKVEVKPSELIFVRPESKADLGAASARVLQRLASRAYRRPAEQQEVVRLQKLVKLVIDDGGSFDDGIRLALQAILVSPHFLYKVEQPPIGDEIRTLNEYELTTALSYFIWNSMPDDPLFKVSFENRLRADGNLEKQITRMLQDERAQAMIENFGLQWLQLRNLDDITPDETMFPGFDDELRRAMRMETEMLLKEIVKNDLSILTLLKADFTFLNERLAKHYDIPNVQGDQFRRVSLQGTQRGGLLSHASILTITSNPTRTSPVKRGKWILENLLGTPPPPPAPDVMPLEQQQLTGTLRERMQQHRDNPSCASCHAQMDPLGFALENFDAIGRWREKDEDASIDALGILPDGAKFNGPAELQDILSQSRREEFVRCFAEKMLTYALGRGLDYYDQCTVDKIMKAAAQEDYRYSAFVKAVVNSDPFQQRRNRGSNQ